MLVGNVRSDNGKNSKEIDIESALIQGKELSHEEIVSLRKQLYRLKSKEFIDSLHRFK